MEDGLARVAAIYEPCGHVSYVGPRRLDLDAGFQPPFSDQLYEPRESFCGGLGGYNLVKDDEAVELRPASEVQVSRVEAHLRAAGGPVRDAGALRGEHRERVA